MENKPVLLEQTLQVSQQGDTKEISIYKPGKVSAEAFAHGTTLIKKVFPKLPEGWYDVLDEMLDEEKFDDDKFHTSVKNLVKTCIYPEPTIANVLSFDKKIKTYTYTELMIRYRDNYYAGSTYSPIDEEYCPVDVGLKQPRYVKIEHQELYKIKKWEIGPEQEEKKNDSPLTKEEQKQWGKILKPVFQKIDKYEPKEPTTKEEKLDRKRKEDEFNRALNKEV